MNGENNKSKLTTLLAFWTTLPGIITAIATLIGAIILILSHGYCSPPTIESFTVSPEEISPGECTKLSWNVSHAKNVSITGIENHAFKGSQKVYPTEDTAYTLTASNTWGLDTCTVYISVIRRPPTIGSFDVSPREIDSGGNAALNWSVSGATEVTIDPEIGHVLSSDSRTVNPAQTTNYTLTATNEAGSVMKTKVVYVRVGRPIIESFDASSEKIFSGESTNLSWKVSDATEVTIITPEIWNVSSSDSKMVSPAQTTTYTLIATNEAGSVNKTKVVYVRPTINIFKVSHEKIFSGESVNLSWSVSGATEVTIIPEIDRVPLDGYESVSPDQTTTYTLIATNEAGSVNKTKVVYVRPTINIFKASSEEIFSGGSVNLSWSVSGATEIAITPYIGAVQSNGSIEVSPAQTTTYTLIATNEAGSVMKTKVVNVDEHIGIIVVTPSR